MKESTTLNIDCNKYKEYSTNVADIREFIVNNLEDILRNNPSCLLGYFAQKKYYSRDLDYTIRALGPILIDKALMPQLMQRLESDLRQIRYQGENLSAYVTCTSETR